MHRNIHVYIFIYIYNYIHILSYMPLYRDQMAWWWLSGESASAKPTAMAPSLGRTTWDFSRSTPNVAVFVNFESLL